MSQGMGSTPPRPPRGREGVTDVVVGHPLQEAGLAPAGRRLDAGGEQAQVRLVDVQGEVCCRAQFDLRTPLVVLWMDGERGTGTGQLLAPPT